MRGGSETGRPWRLPPHPSPALEFPYGRGTRRPLLLEELLELYGPVLGERQAGGGSVHSTRAELD